MGILAATAATAQLVRSVVDDDDERAPVVVDWGDAKDHPNYNPPEDAAGS